MKLFGSEATSFAKAMIILAAIFLVSSGLCGLQLLLSNNATGGWPLFIPLGIIELIAMVLSAAGLVMVLLIGIGSAIYRSLAHPEDDDPKSLFDSLDNSDHDQK